MMFFWQSTIKNFKVYGSTYMECLFFIKQKYMASEINPQKQLQRKSEEIQTIYQKSKKVFQSPSAALLKLGSFAIQNTSNTKNILKNQHIPSIFKKNNLIINELPKNDILPYKSVQTLNNSNKIIHKSSEKQFLPMTQSLGLPQISNINIRKNSQNNEEKKNGKETSVNKKLGKAVWLSKTPKIQNRSPHRFFQKRKTLFTLREATPPPFLKKMKSRANQQSLKLQNFKIGKYLGTGRFGQYFQAIHKQSGFLLCLKRLQKAKIKQNELVDKVVRSITRNLSMKHPHIRNLYGVFEEQNNVYLILQYTENKTLASYLKHHQFNESQSVQKIREIGSALQYIHRNNFIHRGINTQSILMTQGVCKICDFELMTQCIERYESKHINFQQKSQNIKQRPQIKTISCAYDVWCLGIVAYEIMTGKSLDDVVDHKNQRLCQIDIKKNIFPENLSKQAKDLILGLIEPILKNRMTIDEILKYPLVVANQEENLWEKYANRADPRDNKQKTENNFTKSSKYIKLKKAMTNA